MTDFPNTNKGIHVLTNTSPAPVYKNYGGLITTAATVVSAITYADGYDGVGTPTPLPAGVFVPMRFSTITLTSGSAILIKE